jgi:hypothetical protein
MNPDAEWAPRNQFVPLTGRAHPRIGANAVSPARFMTEKPFAFFVDRRARDDNFAP